MSDPNAEPIPQAVVIDGKTYHLVKRRDGAGMQLVKLQPDDMLVDDAVEPRRAQSIATHQEYRASPRLPPQATVETSLDLRAATILSHQADPTVRARLTAGFAPQANQGRRNKSE
jgi:hypothetical protein